MKGSLLITILIMVTIFIHAGEPIKNKSFYGHLAPVSTGEIIEHTYYKLAYSEKNEQALWVYYLLTPTFLNSSIERSDDFRADPKVKTGSATPDDYKNSGTDKGHLCPAGDMKLNETSVSESFYMSNMSPQIPTFNRGIWNKLEGIVREWAKTEDTLAIATGPVFKDNLGVIGENKVTIPGYYYKVILDPTGKMKMIAILLKNSKEPQNIEQGIVSVDSIEHLTGIDFFAGLPDEIESALEKKSDRSSWNFSKSDTDTEKPVIKKSTTEQPSTRCKGIAKSTGMRCKSMTSNKNGYCNDHQKQAQ